MGTQKFFKGTDKICCVWTLPPYFAATLACSCLSLPAPAAQISLAFSDPVLFLIVQLSPTLTLFLPFSHPAWLAAKLVYNYVFTMYWHVIDLQCCVSFWCTWSDSVICIHVFTLSRILFPCRLIQNIEYRFLCYTFSPRWLSVLCIIVCVGKSQNPHLSPW